MTSNLLVQVGKLFGCNFYSDDYQVSFAGFLQHLPFELQMTRSAMETNRYKLTVPAFDLELCYIMGRCFFLHLGIAVSIHPFALQTAFRYYASKAMESAGNKNSILLLL